MAYNLFPIGPALRRLIPRPAHKPNPGIPSELIFEEILPHFKEDTPTSLAGLQVALTCKAFYQALHPLIAQFFVGRLAEAYSESESQRLNISLVEQASTSQMNTQQFENMVKAALAQSSLNYPEATVSGEAVSAFDSPFQITYYVHLGSFDDADLVWALTSLLSKPHVSKYLRKVEIMFVETATSGGHMRGQKPANADANAKWKRAFVKLMDVATEPEGAELHLSLSRSSTAGPKANLGAPPPGSILFPSSRLRKLASTGNVLNCFWHHHLDSLVNRSSRTLTYLHITGANSDDPQTKWHSMLPKWHLPVLDHFEIQISHIPSASLVSFLLLNPSISSAVISTPPESLLSLRPEDYSRFLPQLRSLSAVTELLLALFTPLPKAGAPPCDILLPDLEKLEIIHDSDNFDDVNRALWYAPGPKERGMESRTALRAITINLPYRPREVKSWLESVSPAGHYLDIIDLNFDGLTRTAVLSPLPCPDLTTTLASLTQISHFGLKITIPDCDPFRTAALGRSESPYFSLDPCTVTCFMSGLPAVKEVVLDGLFHRPRAAVKDAGEFWITLASMWLGCSALERIEIRGIGGSATPAIWNAKDVEPTPGLEDWYHAFDDANN